jgi:hypothetical protein
MEIIGYNDHYVEQVGGGCRNSSARIVGQPKDKLQACEIKRKKVPF